MKTPLLNDIFKEFKVLTLDQVSEMRDCSIRTVQRQFAELAVLRSYNKNSRYFTMNDIPRFDTHGIWTYRDIRFSKFGDLRKTGKLLILNSECGLSGGEIGDIVELPPRSFMNHFREMDGVFREKHGGVYVYFSNDPPLYTRQCGKRDQTSAVRKIGDGIAVKLLIAYIKHPEFSMEELSDTLARENGCRVSPAAMANFLLFHDLLKKNPASGP